MASELPSTHAPARSPVNQSRSWWQRDGLQRWLGVIIILSITVTSFWLALHPGWIMRLGRWGYVGAFLISLIASATIVLPAPGLALVIAMSPGLDPILLGLVAGLGSAAGELTGYMAGATGRVLIPIEQRQRFDRLRQLTRRYGAPLLILLAALPLPAFDIAGLVAGALRMRLFTFFAAVSIGKSVKYIFLILIGIESLHLLQRWLG